MLLHRQLRYGNMHLGEIGTWPFIQPCHTHLGLGTHIACIMVETHCRCTAILVQDLLAKATARCIILGNRIIRTGLASKFWPFGKGIGRMILSLAGKCSTPTQLLICSSFSRENGHLLLICSSLSTTQLDLLFPTDWKKWGDTNMPFNGHQLAKKYNITYQTTHPRYLRCLKQINLEKTPIILGRIHRLNHRNNNNNNNNNNNQKKHTNNKKQTTIKQ